MLDLSDRGIVSVLAVAQAVAERKDAECTVWKLLHSVEPEIGPAAVSVLENAVVDLIRTIEGEALSRLLVVMESIGDARGHAFVGPDRE